MRILVDFGWIGLCLTVATSTIRRSEARRTARGPLTTRQGIYRQAVLRALRSVASAPGLASVERVLQSLSRRQRARRRGQLLTREIPILIDLIAVGVGAGNSLLQALELAQRWSPSVVGDEVREVLQRVDHGALLADALLIQSRRTHEVRPLTESLVTAIRLGSPLQPTLRRIAAEYRSTQLRVSAAHARTVPVRLIFPLVIFVLPAFALITVVPALIAGWRGI